ncbi:MAG: hypothetical protein ACRDBY_10190 [Cetobacterium sp.]
MKKIVIFFIGIYLCSLSFANPNLTKPMEKLEINEIIKPNLPSEIPLIPIIPSLPNTIENIDGDGNIRNLEKNYTVVVEAKVNIFVPLEIVSDINIDATVYDDQVVEVPFEIELNKEPEKKNYYKLKYSETEIDIDNDGRIDTYIYSPEFVNTKYIRDNFVRIHGERITSEGDYTKKVYVTVEAGI